jgi:hypothetical protein
MAARTVLGDLGLERMEQAHLLGEGRLERLGPDLVWTLEHPTATSP